jgi:hypothetical protein
MLLFKTRLRVLRPEREWSQAQLAAQVDVTRQTINAKKQKTKPTKGVFPMQQLSKQPAFELGQIVATPGALAALQKAGQQPGEFLTRHVNRE